MPARWASNPRLLGRRDVNPFYMCPCGHWFLSAMAAWVHQRFQHPETVVVVSNDAA